MKASTLAAIKVDVVEFVKAHFPDARVQIIGGYARDLFFGQTPKDLDLTVPVGEQCPSHMFELTEMLAAILSQAAPGRRVEISQAYESAAGDFNERIHTLLQVHCEDGTEVDVMFHRANSVMEVWDSYDSNVNTVMIEDGQFVWKESPVPVRLLKPLTEARAARLKEVAVSLGLTYDDTSFDHFTIPAGIPDL